MLIPSSFYSLYPISQLKLLPSYGDYILLSAIFCHLTYLLAAYISPTFTHYKVLSKSKQASWCIHVVSEVFTTLVLILNTMIFNTPVLHEDKLFGVDHYATLVFAFACGYFLWDAIMSVYWMSETGPAFVFHGTACFLVFLLAFLPFNHYYGTVFLYFEASTFFLNIHWFCDKVGLSGSSLQWINGIFLLLAFFSFRIVFGTYKMAEFIYVGYSVRNTMPLVYYFYSIAAIGLGTLNFYWFGLMISSVRSRFNKKKTQ